jgi:hypothetical protein
MVAYVFQGLRDGNFPLKEVERLGITGKSMFDDLLIFS